MKRSSSLLLTLLLITFSITFLNCGGGSSSVAPAPAPGPSANAQFALLQRPTGGNAPSVISGAERAYRAKHPELFLGNRIRPGNGLKAVTGDMFSGQDSVVLMNDDGTGQQVIATGYSVQSVQESADGKKGVAAAVDDYGKLQIYYVNLADKNNIQITQLTNSAENHFSPQLSWDGSKIVYTKQLEDTLLHAFVISSSGGTETEIQTSFGVITPSFTPDGRIVFQKQDTDGIAIMNADGGGVTQLTNPEGGTYDEMPSVSPDGNTIVFDSYVDPVGATVDIWSMSVNGGNLKQLTTDGLSADPTYVNNKLVFVSWRDETATEIYSMNTDGSNQKRLTNNTVLDFFDDWVYLGP